MKSLAIIGTTASGKTALALDLASLFNGVILSLDSLCVYKQIDIASAKPTKFELESVPHFGVDLLFCDEEFNAGMFFEIYKQAADFAQKNQKNLFIVGGTGFYLKALLSGLTPKFDKALSYAKNDEIYNLILQNDPDFAAKFSQNDTYRLQKWFDIFSFLKQNQISQTPSEFLQTNTHEPILRDLQIFDILWDRQILRDRIKARTENMLQNGLLDEAKYLFDKYPNEPKPLKSIGLKECGDYLGGKISKDELREQISTHTAQLAKRQRTFNKSQFLNKFTGSIDECRSAILEYLQS